MKASRDTSTSVVRLAVLAGFWAVACTPASNNQTGAGGASGGARTGGNTGSGGSGSGGSNAGGSGSGGSNAGGSGSGGSNAGGSGSGGSGDGGSNAGGSGSGGSGDGGSNSGGSSAGGSSSGGSSSGGSSSGGSNSGGSSSGGSSAGGYNSGGSSAGGSSSGGSSAGGSSAGGSAAGGTTSTSGCSTVWDWEGTGLDSWTAATDVTLAVSTTQKVTGTQSLKATIPALTSKAADDAGGAATDDKRVISISPGTTSNLWPGATVTVNVWIPTGTTGLWIHVFMQSNNWVNWSDTTVGTPTPGAWSALTFTVPAATVIFPGGINQFGLQLGVSGGGTFAGGDIFIDSITVCGGAQACSGTGTGSFDFETAGSTDGWAFKGDTSVTDTVVTQSTTQHYGTTGSGSLKVAMTAIPAAPATGWTSRLVELGNPKVYCGQTVTYHVMADNVTGLTVQPYISANGWAWFAGNGVTLTATNTWTTVTYTLPTTINFLGLQAMGLQVSNASTTATYTGNVYIDGISWQ